MYAGQYLPVKQYEQELRWIVADTRLFHALVKQGRNRTVISSIMLEGASYEEVGEMIELSKERIRQIYVKSLHELKMEVSKAVTSFPFMKEIETENGKLRNALRALQERSEQLDLKPMPGLLEKNLSEFQEVPLRAMDALRSKHIITVGDLLHYTPQDISKLRNIGGKCIIDLQEFLKKYGVEW